MTFCVLAGVGVSKPIFGPETETGNEDETSNGSVGGSSDCLDRRNRRSDNTFRGRVRHGAGQSYPAYSASTRSGCDTTGPGH